MTVPGRREAARLLLSLDPPDWFLRHSCAVADVAGWLAGRSVARGAPVDARAVEAAALLHDVDKLARVGRGDGVRHGDGSAAWLREHGMPELAELVRDHPVTRLGTDDGVARLAVAPLEARIVAYADKRAGGSLESMDARFASWRRRYPVAASPVPHHGHAAWTDDEVARIRQRADDLEQSVCAAAGVTPGEVRRLRWSRRALREAAR